MPFSTSEVKALSWVQQNSPKSSVAGESVLVTAVKWMVELFLLLRVCHYIILVVLQEKNASSGRGLWSYTFANTAEHQEPALKWSIPFPEFHVPPHTSTTILKSIVSSCFQQLWNPTSLLRRNYRPRIDFFLPKRRPLNYRNSDGSPNCHALSGVALPASPDSKFQVKKGIFHCLETRTQTPRTAPHAEFSKAKIKPTV